MSGTATEIANHIENIAKLKNYRPTNKNVKAKVFQILPERTPGRIKQNSDRKYISDTFHYDTETKTYHLAGIWFQAKLHQLELQVKPFIPRKHSGEKISIETPKDKSKQHDEILKKLYDYARDKNYTFEHEKENIDLLMKSVDDGGNEKWIINEVKSYKNSIYTAVGQIQWYKFKLMTNYKNVTSKNIAMLNIVGNFNLDPQHKKFLDELKINYINIKEIDRFL